jgi:hypothetical protein
MARWEQAEAHFEQALAMNARMGAMPWLARTQFQYAQMLLARRAPGDSERARILLGDALDIAMQFGMRSLETRIATVSPAAFSG